MPFSGCAWYSVDLIDQGAVVQNLPKSVAIVILKFLSWNVANTLIFFAEKNVSSFCITKATHIFAEKSINLFEYTLATTVNEFAINELMKLTMLWTIGPKLIMLGLCVCYRIYHKYLDISIPYKNYPKII